MRPAGIGIGVDVGGTKILAVGLDCADPTTVRSAARVPTPRGADAIIDAIESAVAAVIAELGTPAGVGLGVPGLVDRDGVLHIGPNLPGIIGVPFAERLTERLSLPVTVDNDATCAAWGERLAGAAQGFDDALLITLGTGIGAGIVAGGELQRGANGFAGEPGHMIVDPNGPPCPCGRRGCWERFASGSGLARLAREAAVAGQLESVVALAGGDPEAVRGEHVAALARDGDAGASEVLRRFGWWLALGIANLVTILDPAVVVVGGGLIELGDLLLHPTREAYEGLVMAGDHRPSVGIVPAALGEHAGAIGAALLPRA